MLTEISEWLENHPQEVVILACRNFKGMMEDLHEYLMGCIKNIFGDMLCPMGCEQGPQAPHALGSGGGGSPRPHCNQTIHSLREADSGTR